MSLTQILGTNPVGMDTKIYQLVANVPLGVNTPGDFVMCTSCTAPFTVRFDDQGYTLLDNNVAYKLEANFKKCFLLSTVNQTVQIVVGFGECINNRLYVPSAVTIGATIVNGNTFTPLADVSMTAGAAVQIMAANANRKSLTISSNINNAGSLRLGDSTVTATKGLELAPGSTVSLDTTAAVYGWNTTGTTFSVSAVENSYV
jgi:hypothetical protein